MYNTIIEAEFCKIVAPALEEIPKHLLKEIKDAVKLFARANTLRAMEQQSEKMNYSYFYERHNKQIVEYVMKYSEKLAIPFPMLAGKTRTGTLRDSRNVIWFVLVEEFGASDSTYKMIGDLFNRDRSTIRASYTKTKDSVEMNDKFLRAMIDRLKE